MSEKEIPWNPLPHPPESVTDTGLGIQVRRGKYPDKYSIGEAGQLSDGTWEVHLEPVESTPFLYVATADEAIKCLVWIDDDDKEIAAETERRRVEEQ